ncbi:hypothetical protein B296_00004650 [Ensete ventricosum]|uniref:Uncharacterized protein n=1 Tax=Ensete ventricosum TaxID=4639 RepID=A0A427B7I8_ENSVE|nr:hypothetical protein B296_00004650 [Ensete ventricosum]
MVSKYGEPVGGGGLLGSDPHMVKPSRRVRLSLLLSCFLATLPDDARDPTQLVYVGSVLARPLRCLSHRDREEGVTREWVGKSELPKERMQSEMAGPYDMLAEVT